MGSAKALTFVSYFEGFGIPLVEAMMAGTPILCGNKTSLPEVAGEAALYVDPFSVEEITAGLVKMDTDETLRNQLIQNGFEQSKKFNWDFTAQICWDTILKHLPK
jgi:glycosyltransferase involved in cell wall biosynthesis